MFTFRFNDFARFTPWQGQSPLGRMTSRWPGRPAWVWGLAMLAAVPFVLVIALLAMAALFTAAAVYLLLGAVHEGFVRIRSAMGYDGHGRRNVRVRTGTDPSV